MLSERQELILRLVVEAHLDSARPVPSKEVAERPEVEWGPSTVRAELAALEAAGYDPPGGGVAPAAEQGGGNRVRLHRGRPPPRLRLRSPGRPRPGRVGLQ